MNRIGPVVVRWWAVVLTGHWAYPAQNLEPQGTADQGLQLFPTCRQVRRHGQETGAQVGFGRGEQHPLGGRAGPFSHPNIGIGNVGTIRTSARVNTHPAPLQEGFVPAPVAADLVLPAPGRGNVEPGRAERASLHYPAGSQTPPHRSPAAHRPFGGYPALLFVQPSPGPAATFPAVTGLCLGVSFAASRRGCRCWPTISRIDFFGRQVMLSRNTRGGQLASSAMGGLKYQIEHHRFPTMAPPESTQSPSPAQSILPYPRRRNPESQHRGAWRIVVTHLNQVWPPSHFTAQPRRRCGAHHELFG
jgi:hypothetical protein